MKMVALMMAIFMCMAFGEQVRISSEIWSWESKKDKDRVLLEVKGKNKREVSDELIVGCVKYHKKKKHRIGDEIIYYIFYSSDDALIGGCRFLKTETFDDGTARYVITIFWNSGGYILYRVIDNKQTKKLDIVSMEEDWSM